MVTSWARQEPGSFPLTVYLEEGQVQTEVRNRDNAFYLPLTQLLNGMALPYTDATATRTLTVRGDRGVLQATDGTATIMIDGLPLDLEYPVLREADGWLGGVDFLTRGLAAIMGIDFRIEGNATSVPRRIVAGNVRPTRLDMEAVQTDGLARLTLRSSESVNVRVQQDPDANRVVLMIDRSPVIPRMESLDFRNPSIRSVRFDDADGQAKVIIETQPELANVRLVPMEENRTFLVEFVSLNAPPVVPEPLRDVETDPRLSLDRVRVIVIDPGHGGLDGGTSTSGVLEKDLTLALALRLRNRLQTLLDGTVILTRSQDTPMTEAERSAIANNNEADLLISLHVGFSNDPTESTASLFLMRSSAPRDDREARGRLFQPWFEAFQGQRDSSRAFAAALRGRLVEAVPGWEFAIQEAPLALLASAAMPAVLVELGNANNAEDMGLLGRPEFQERLIEAIATSITAFGAEQVSDEETL